MVLRVYRAARGEAVVLPGPPPLASWNRRDDAAQVALGTYLAALEALVRPALERQSDSLALEVTVGLPADVDLISGGRDLDNYLSPIVDWLGRERFVSGRGRKIHSETSSVVIGPAKPIAERVSTGGPSVQ